MQKEIFLNLLILLILSEFTGSKRVTSKNLYDSKKPTECQRCQILTDSFEHWLSKTSRGKHEGGDAAWEEAKLKSYSRSELRLIEIQEGLCSELKVKQDACYAIAEETEQLLEKWWFQEGSTAPDLKTWLCIESLKSCCPKGHFGEACSPCPQDKKQKLCAGFGTCDGDGTRVGNGSCLCRKGYSGIACEECANNYYSTNKGLCESCHESCDGCVGTPNSCINCNSGWQFIGDWCVDVNECLKNVCEPNQYCINTVGSFHCNECDQSCKSCMGEGISNCTSCEHPKTLWFSMCVDSEVKQQIITNTFKRLALYVGLFIISLYIYRSSSLLASFVIVIIAIYIYFSEITQRVTTAKVLFDNNQSS